MDKAKYEWIKKVRKLRDAIRAKRNSGDKSYLARKIAARRKYFTQKREAIDRNFEGKKQARVGREHGRWNRKSLKWNAKGSKWTGKWEHRAARFNARMAKGL